MYTEEYERKGFPIKGFLMRLLLVIIFVLLLIWLLPKFITPVVKTDSKSASGCNGGSTCDLTGVKALTSQIFSNNLDKMKDAAISYYTDERLPQNVGDSSQMTLSDMIGKKLIPALIDKNNKAVDVEKSYVKITKMEDEYLLKVNIKDSEKEDYILVHLGCYTYCKNTYLCQKQTTTTTGAVKAGKTTAIVPIINPTPSYNPTPTPTPTPSNPTCRYANGHYYDANSNKVSELNYIVSCEAPKCKIVNGYYFGKNGNNVTRSTYINECQTKPDKKHTCVLYNGNYYDKNGNKVTEVDYLISCHAPVCRKVNGYYFGKNGNNVSESTFNSECTTKKTHTCVLYNGNYYDKNGKVVSEVNYLISCHAPVCKKVNGYYFGKNGTNVSQSTFNSECTTQKTHTCVYYNGNYYNKNGKAVSEVDYLISCHAPVCRIVNGYYFGKNGNNVNKSTFESECTTQKTHTCVYYNGNYYDKNGNAVSEVNYLISCHAPKCRKVNGYYFGKNGNNVSKSTFDAECTTTTEYVYEYSKTTGAKFSDWSSWSNWTKTDCGTKEVNCSDQDVTCLNKLQMTTRKEKIGTYQKTYAKKRNVVKQTGSYQEKSCNKYNYVEINKTLYATTTTTTYTTVNTITTTTRTTHGGWTYNGRGSYSNPPSDTSTTHYTFAGADYSNCGDTCTSLPNYYYDSYTYTGGLTSVSSTTTPGKTTTSSSSTTTPVSTETSYEASCGGYTVKTIPIYGTITVTEKASRTEPLYGDVCYKSTKSRTLISKGSTQTKWSKYNDTSLLNNGWVYTGNKKVK